MVARPHTSVTLRSCQELLSELLLAPMLTGLADVLTLGTLTTLTDRLDICMLPPVGGIPTAQRCHCWLHIAGCSLLE